MKWNEGKNKGDMSGDPYLKLTSSFLIVTVWFLKFFVNQDTCTCVYIN